MGDSFMNKNRTFNGEKNNFYTTFGEKNKIKIIGRLRAQPLKITTTFREIL